MSFKSLSDPFNPNKSLLHKSDCDCPVCQTEKAGVNLSDYENRR